MATLVFHQGALGDWVITFPILRSLATKGSPVFVVTSRGKAELASRMIAGVQPIDIEQRYFTQLHAPSQARHDRPAAAIRELCAAATRIISCVSDGRDAWARNVAALAPQASIYFIDPRPPAAETTHITDWLLRQLCEQGLPLVPIDAAPRDNPGGPIVVHPGSGGAHKCWPVENYLSLLDELRKRDIPTRVIWGEVEEETWPPHRLTELREQYDGQSLSTLDELHDALADAAAFIGNDAGPTHLAAAMGLPTIAIFGPTDPDIWAPRGRCVVMRRPDVKDVVREIAVMTRK